jgi:hypothetical protein
MTTNNNNNAAANTTATLAIGAYEHGRRGYFNVDTGEKVSKRDILETIRDLGAGNDLIDLYVTVEIAAMDANRGKGKSNVSDKELAERAEMDEKVHEYLTGLNGATAKAKLIGLAVGASTAKVTASLKRLADTNRVEKTYDKDGAVYAAK